MRKNLIASAVDDGTRPSARLHTVQQLVEQAVRDVMDSECVSIAQLSGD